MSGVKATIYAQSADERTWDAEKCLAFVTERSWWNPPKVTGPDRALELYGI